MPTLPQSGSGADPQAVAYSFDSAEHGAALFNLEAEGYRYTRIGNPTNAVLEQRVAMLEGGVDALSCNSGQTALYYAALNVAEAGRNIISPPQLYGTTHTLFAHVLPKLGVTVLLCEVRSQSGGSRGVDRRGYAWRCSERRWEILLVTCATWRRWPRWRIAPGCR